LGGGSGAFLAGSVFAALASLSAEPFPALRRQVTVRRTWRARFRCGLSARATFARSSCCSPSRARWGSSIRSAFRSTCLTWWARPRTR
jgi:hypothetical protein